MALDVYLQKDNNPPTTVDELFLQFEDDGYYWFLFKYFEDLAKQTGQMVDLYDDAFFYGDNLDYLHQKILRVREDVTQKPEFWEEFAETTFEKGLEQK